MKRLAIVAALIACATALATPSGKKWQVTQPIPYRVFAHTGIKGLPTGFSTNVLPAVQRGFGRWTSLQVSCTKWASTYAGSFTTPSNQTAVGNDGTNRVIWLGGADWTHGSQTLGLTTTVYYTSTGQIIDADMELNNDATWKLGGAASYQVDVESILTHEAGHFLGLDHSTPTAAVMYAFYDVPNGEIKRNLTSTDLTDVCTMYPTTTGLGAQGDICTSSSQCGSTSPACRGAVGSTSMICTKDCTTDSNCPTGYTCQSSNPAGTTGKACLPPAGASDLCKFCTNGTQCSTGQCVTNGPQNWCTRTCLGDADCGSGYSCVQGTTSKVCVPNSNKCPIAQCTSNNNCPVGYTCLNGMCEASGNVGDRCETSTYCKPCSMCIWHTSSEAYCSACCSGGTGTTCQGCNSSTCASGYSCEQVTGTTDKICYPTSGSDLCQACDTQTPCKAGMSCFNNRCHAACNLASPGSCSACFDSGTGGLCACPGEAAGTGSPCGQLATGFVACTTGNACVGQPKTCRAKCELSNPSSCGSGETCQSVEGQAVCVSSQTPGQKCSPCENGQCATGLTCVSGRCYESCNVSVPACTTCVEAAPSVGICACSDQLTSVGQGCGVFSGEVYACAPGGVCVNSVCQLQCDPNAPSCPVGQTCQLAGTVYACSSSGGGGGGTDAGSGGGGGFPTTDGGTAKPGSNNAGCGCSGGSGSAVVWTVGVLVAVVSRKRRGGFRGSSRV